MKQLSLTGGISGLLSSALSLGLATQMFPNTGLQNLTDNVSFNGKTITNLGGAVWIVDGDSGLPAE